MGNTVTLLVRDIRIPYTEGTEAACEKAGKAVLHAFGRKMPAILETKLHKTSIDARKKPDILIVCSVLVTVACHLSAAAAAMKCDNRISVFEEQELPALQPQPDAKKMENRPVIVGFGPAGMLAALVLCERGFSPIILERGDDVQERRAAVHRFYETQKLDPDSNIQFGAGGAGTFSDGKLMTRISDPFCSYVLSQFVRFGADPEILTKAKPHVGTDILLDVVANIRDHLCACGCELRFRTKMTGLRTVETASGTRVTAVKTDHGDIPAGAVILALGHSARDTYEMLFAHGIAIAPKPFSVGVRIEHLQSDMNIAAYGAAAAHTAACGAVRNGIFLPPAEYAVSHKMKPSQSDPDPRGVYSFCMCPGGEVMAAASEYGGVVVNGMSRHARDGVNANAALAVSVRTSDYGDHPMKAIAYQRQLEQAAFRAGGEMYAAPCQTVGDLLTGTHGTEPGRVQPSYMNGHVRITDLRDVLPAFVTELLCDGIRRFDRQLPGFASADAILTGVETRTSAPVRILRREHYQAFGCDNLYPIGEGAGYAGGITSAAVDGIRCAMRIAEKYKV